MQNEVRPGDRSPRPRHLRNVAPGRWCALKALLMLDLRGRPIMLQKLPVLNLDL